MGLLPSFLSFLLLSILSLSHRSLSSLLLPHIVSFSSFHSLFSFISSFFFLSITLPPFQFILFPLPPFLPPLVFVHLFIYLILSFVVHLFIYLILSFVVHLFIYLILSFVVHPFVSSPCFCSFISWSICSLPPQVGWTMVHFPRLRLP